MACWICGQCLAEWAACPRSSRTKPSDVFAFWLPIGILSFCREGFKRPAPGARTEHTSPKRAPSQNNPKPQARRPCKTLCHQVLLCWPLQHKTQMTVMPSIYIYILRERERDLNIYICIHSHTYIHTYVDLAACAGDARGRSDEELGSALAGTRSYLLNYPESPINPIIY